MDTASSSAQSTVFFVVDSVYKYRLRIDWQFLAPFLPHLGPTGYFYLVQQ